MILDFNPPRLGLTQINPAPLVRTIQGFGSAPPR
jgi:hypothetical protein